MPRDDLSRHESIVARGVQRRGALERGARGAAMPYASNDELYASLDALARGACAGVSRVVSIGASAKGVDVRALEVGSTSSSTMARGDDDGNAVDGRNDPYASFSGAGRLRFGFMANMHGDEPSGRVITVEVARRVCEGAKTGGDALAKRLIDEATLYIIPTVNPDGFAMHARGNSRGVDLNRNFPYTQFTPPRDASGSVKALGGKLGDNAVTEPETAMIMRFSERVRMAAVLNYHEGALVANYPWDGNERGGNTYSSAPDDETFKYLASTYATSHPVMSKSQEFKGGITNGAAWYPLWGGMQDWHYVNTGTMDLTIEVDDAKWPQDDKIDKIVDDHVKASLEMVSKALFGSVRGFVLDENGVGVAGVSVKVGDKGLPVLTDSAGFFAKPSAPTSRQVTVHITPPNDVYLYPTTHVVEAIDETNGATIDVSLATRERPGFARGAARARVFVVFVVLLAAILAIRRTYKRRRRVATIMESMQNNPDIEKAVANRRGSARAPPLASTA